MQNDHWFQFLLKYRGRRVKDPSPIGPPLHVHSYLHAKLMQRHY